MKKDWLLFLDLILIIIVGLTTLYSTVIDSESILSGGIFNRQLLFVVLGLAIYFAVSFFDYRFLNHIVFMGPLIAVVVILLVYVLAAGVEINNARRWILIGGIQLQPSEFAKLILLVVTAWIFSMKTKLKLGIQIALASVIALLFIVLIFLEPDAGTSVVLGGIWFLTIFSVLPNQTFNAAILLIIAAVGVATEAILFKNVTLGIITGGIAIAVTGGTFLISKKMRVLPFIAIIAGIMFGLGGFYVWNNVFHDYQRERIETFINPSGKSLDEAFQVEQSKVAIGSGMIFGKGFGLGTQSKLRFVPEHQTDFIFASFAEEFGLIGSTFLLFLYGVLITRIFRAAVVVENRFGSIICLAVGIKILIEVFINIGMNVGVVPATGVPLPLMSAGGSLLLVTMIGLGLVQSTLIHREE